jgi:hypothetical protein
MPYPNVVHPHGLVVSTLGLSFTVTSSHFLNGSMKVRCVASVSPILWRGDRESVVQRVSPEVKTNVREALILRKSQYDVSTLNCPRPSKLLTAYRGPIGRILASYSESPRFESRLRGGLSGDRAVRRTHSLKYSDGVECCDSTVNVKPKYWDRYLHLSSHVYQRGWNITSTNICLWSCLINRPSSFLMVTREYVRYINNTGNVLLLNVRVIFVAVEKR